MAAIIAIAGINIVIEVLGCVDMDWLSGPVGLELGYVCTYVAVGVEQVVSGGRLIEVGELVMTVDVVRSTSI